jgi:UDP-galactose transporter B1
MGNLVLDGVTNNELDSIFSKQGVTALQTMQYVDFWQCVYLGVGLLSGWLYSICVDGNAGSSEAVAALHALSHSKALRHDLLLFCTAAALGKILIYGIMAQYGSLTCITIGVTRKVFTILVSVLVFGHHFCHEMWAGVGLVALGLAMEVSTSTTGADMLSQKEKSE